MRSGGISHGVVLNAFSIDEWRGRWLAGVDVLADGKQIRPIDAGTAPALGERLVAFNRWLVDSVRGIPEITPFVAVDPWVLSPADLARHLGDMRERGARGVKIHPIDQRFMPDDPRMLETYRRCLELGLIVLSHSGTSRGELQFGEPDAFASVAAAMPDLRLVLAHMGGGSWQQLGSLAEAFPRVTFDLSEIVAWIDAPHAPTGQDLVSLIRRIGVDRVMFGSDFPWYDPGVMAETVGGLPGLSQAETHAILGGNAVRILDLSL